ncbi:MULTISPECIES: hypothetical protein [Bradyrhizobium]|uniref:Uncharacterized protein n=1 Tax=Bradyrhizobium diazoefficiens TaxID=1355477 RepID=A0A809YPN5_9BRAD|nr:MULTISPECIES: hypothetical protein [Bradyrhizobium]MBP1062511.1 hypothetical protein [Bradyrhizobium japonicum]MBP1095453.1 hypothetical protein [Bradyrhizobium japonicum]QJS41153.1 hypothetical protein DI395_46655 [Bradyrhizobium diazoefficiens]QLD41283.1 hypothetical protein HUW42_09900 [Bradyrhizobium diazoefficiens]WLA55352.1 hypothetical protein QIH81_33215 [Bradyrhizobium diazoefficiens]
MAINKEWHRSHRMPPKATREQRVKWHAAHAAACGCRDVPASIRLDVMKLLRSRRKP